MGGDVYTIYPAMGDAATVTTSYDPDWLHFGTNLYDPENPPGPGKWFEVDFHCTLEGDVYIYLTDGTGYVIEDAILVHQVPEPMAIMLLGLGGLFLRRRKK